MAVNKEQALRKAEALESAVSAMVEYLADPQRPGQIPEDHRGLVERLMAIENELAGLSELLGARVKESEISTFFASIGTSVVAAQQSLDRESREYLKSIGGQDHILPTVFRIPKVSAQIKCGLEQRRGKGFNIVLFSQREEAVTRHQQTLHFDIAAVPPSPESLEKILGLLPRVEMVLSPGMRDRVFGAVAASGGYRWKVLWDNRDRVLVCPTESRECYLLLFAHPDEVKHVGLWHLDLQSGSLAPVYKYDRRPDEGEDLEPLRNQIFSLAKKQSDYLSGIR